MVMHIIGAVITALIILGGLFTIIRNFARFLIDSLRGHPGKAWIDRPYLFRAIAATATIFWLFAPYHDTNNTLNLDASQQQWASFGLYLTAAAAWLWMLRISFLNSIPAEMVPLRTKQKGRLSWQAVGVIGFLVQLLFAAGVGALFAFTTNIEALFAFIPSGVLSVLERVAIFVLLLASAFMSLWRTSFAAAGPDHTFAERLQHVVGGPAAGPPHAQAETQEE